MLETGYTVTLLCAIAGVTRSDYYKWMWIKRHEEPSEKQLADTELKKKILECHKELRGIYEYRRIQVWLEATYNLHLNYKGIQRLMSELGIKALIRKK